jgi:hypothetical protein
MTGIQSGDHDVALTGQLVGVKSSVDGGLKATLQAPDRSARLVFPPLDEPHPIVNGTRLTIGGAYAGDTIQVEAVSA